MSVNAGDPKINYSINLDVPENLIENIISKGKKPSYLLSKLIQKLLAEMEIDEILEYIEGKKSINERLKMKIEDKQIKKIYNITSWTYPTFEKYMENLISENRIRASAADLISMLIAYYKTNSRPTSDELRIARGFERGDNWYEELRVSKARMTIIAKHLGLPSFFNRAYGSGLNRRHPMNEQVYNFLRKWLSVNKSTIDMFEKTPTPRSLM